jgi:lipopolysaccharide/colanic/teichoic acid biosynthesis glycosyltransferase
MSDRTPPLRIIKRVFDVATSILLLVTFWPVMLLTWVIIRRKMGSPALLRQTRPGLGELPFVLYKFRTMTDERGPDGELLPDADRLTDLGRTLRRLSLDELPQLLNVIKGDMSLVGPRPLRMDYLPYFTERERLRQTVPPGITGWAQIHGRNEAAWDQRLAADVWYVENWSLLLDVKILFATLARVLQRKNVVDDPRSIMLNLNEERAHMIRRAS